MFFRRVLRDVLTVATLFCAGMAGAQLTTASLGGTIADATGAVVPHAKVTITNVDTHYVAKAVADDAGYYHADLLPIGHYSVVVEAEGFEKFVQQNITLSVNDQARVATGGESGERDGRANDQHDRGRRSSHSRPEYLQPVAAGAGRPEPDERKYSWLPAGGGADQWRDDGKQYGYGELLPGRRPGHDGGAYDGEPAAES
jgi:hypothetical protein